MKSKYILFIFSIFFVTEIGWANQTLKCISTDYRLNASHYTKSWGKGWVPESFNILIKPDGITVLGKKATVTTNSENKLKFYLKTKHKTQTYTIRKFIYFKSSGKFNVSFTLPGGYADPGDIWGKCSVD